MCVCVCRTDGIIEIMIRDYHHTIDLFGSFKRLDFKAFVLMFAKALMIFIYSFFLGTTSINICFRGIYRKFINIFYTYAFILN